MPATPATDREPSPRPPCRCYFICWGRVSVSRPIEGLDSLRASRTLRTLDLRASGSASRVPSRLHGRVSSYVYATTSPQAGMSRSKRRGLTSCTVARLCWMNFADAKRPRCWQVSVASAACGWRPSCRAPRWGETRHLFPNKPGSSGRVDGGLDRGPLQAWRAPARGRASAERGPAAVLPKQSWARARRTRPFRPRFSRACDRETSPRPPCRSRGARQERPPRSGGPKRRRRKRNHPNVTSLRHQTSRTAACSRPQKSDY